MAPALGPEGTSLSGPRHLLLFLLLLLLLRRRRRGPGGSHCQDLALLPDTLTPRPSQEGARACAAPDLGAINHARPGCAQRQHLARGSRLGQLAEPEGRGEQEARGRGAPGRGCRHRPFSLPQDAPGQLRRAIVSQARRRAKRWNHAAQPPSSLLPGGGHATTCPPPSGHPLVSRWAPSPAPAAPARRGPLGRAPPARPGYKQLGSVGGWFCALLSRAPPPQPPGDPAPRTSRTRRTPPSRARREAHGGSGTAAAGAWGTAVRPVAATGIRVHAR